jgi:hypothetical protein
MNFRDRFAIYDNMNMLSKTYDKYPTLENACEMFNYAITHKKIMFEMCDPFWYKTACELRDLSIFLKEAVDENRRLFPDQVWREYSRLFGTVIHLTIQMIKRNPWNNPPLLEDLESDVIQMIKHVDDVTCVENVSKLFRYLLNNKKDIFERDGNSKTWNKYLNYIYNLTLSFGDNDDIAFKEMLDVVQPLCRNYLEKNDQFFIDNKIPEQYLPKLVLTCRNSFRKWRRAVHERREQRKYENATHVGFSNESTIPVEVIVWK